jgi:CRP/FNR family cyclic AMP-dependent transcriptional regulator
MTSSLAPPGPAMRWPIIAGIPEDDGRRLLEVARRRTFGRREVVFHRGDPADTLHLVQRGRFAVNIATPLGDTLTLSMVGPGETFGEMALLADTAPRSATVVALDGGETRAIHKLDFDALYTKHPGVADILARALALQVRRLSELLVEAHHESAERRVLRRLAELGDDGGVVPLTQEELSNLAGTSRATVNRVVREAQSRGELALRRGRIGVIDAAALSGRAN